MIARVATERESVKLPVPVAFTARVMVVVAVSVPEVPVMVTVNAPVVAVLLPVSVRTLLPVVGLVPNAAVTPVGSPDAASVTLPVKGLTSATVMVSVTLLPCVTVRVDAEGESVKLPPAPGTVTVMVTELVTVPLVPTILIG